MAMKKMCVHRCMLLGDLLEPALLPELQPCIARLATLFDPTRDQSLHDSAAAHQSPSLALARVIVSAADTVSPAELKKLLVELAGMLELPITEAEAEEIVEQSR